MLTVEDPRQYDAVCGLVGLFVVVVFLLLIRLSLSLERLAG